MIAETYDAFLKMFEILPMPEDFKAVRGHRIKPAPYAPVVLRVARGSFAHLPVSVVVPEECIFTTEVRPGFSRHMPVGEQQILRAALSCAPFAGKVCPLGFIRDTDGGEKADVLLECDVEMRPWMPNQASVLIDIPSDAEPGDYEAKVTFYAHAMFYDERVVTEIPFTIRVEKAVIPQGDDRAFYLNLWQHNFNIARHLEVPAYTARHIEALRPFVKSLCALGCRVATVVLSDAAWGGQGAFEYWNNPSDLYEYNYVRIRKDRDGHFKYDFSFADAYIGLMAEYGAKDIMFTGLYGIWTNREFGCVVEDWPDAIRVSYVDETDGAIRFMRTRAEVKDYFRAVYQWIVNTGKLERSVVMGDEVDLGGKTEGWTEMLRIFHELMPGIRMEWDNAPWSMRTDEYKNEPVDVYTPGIDAIAKAKKEDLDAAYARVREGGHILWSTCCYPPLPNSFLGCKLTEVRLHGLITRHMRTEGFLRWNYTVWPADPRARLDIQTWPVGDCCFVYPAKDGGCLLSLRYLALRRGIEDFELAHLVESTVENGAAIAEKAVAKVVVEPDMAKWDFDNYFEEGRERLYSGDINDYEEARGLLLDALR